MPTFKEINEQTILETIKKMNMLRALQWQVRLAFPKKTRILKTG